MRIISPNLKATSIFLLSTVVFFVSSCDMFTYEKKKKDKQVLKEIGFNEQGDTVITAYRKNGSLKSKITVKNGKRNGQAWRYYENGNIQFEIYYKNSFKDGIVKYNYKSGKTFRITQYTQGKKEGIQKYFYEEGPLKAEVPYNNNMVIRGTKEYSKTGKRIDDYPKIVIKAVDKLAFENLYELHLSLQPKRGETSFFFLSKVGGEYYRIYLFQDKKKGYYYESFTLYPGYSIMKKLEFYVEFKSKRGVPVVLRRFYNLAAENRNY